jgi:hypothetical protein
MVINSTNIKKTNNHLSSQLNSLNIKKTMTYDIGSPGPGLGHVLFFIPVCITNLNHDVKARNDNSGRDWCITFVLVLAYLYVYGQNVGRYVVALLTFVKVMSLENHFTERKKNMERVVELVRYKTTNCGI